MISKTRLSKDLKSIISEVACVPASNIKNSTNLQKDLGIDSFNAAEILVAVEKKYKIVVNQGDVFNLTYFREVISLVEGYLNK